MKYKAMTTICALFLFCLTLTGSAFATFIGTTGGQDLTNGGDISDFQSFLVSQGLSDSVIPLAKIGAGGTELYNDDFSDIDWGVYSFTDDPSVDKLSSGTWESSLLGVDYVTVKAGRKFSVFSVDHLGSGEWNTFDITNKKGIPKDLSHISFWSKSTPPTPPGDGAQVPEPATIFLLGSGLLGLFGFRKKFWKSKK
jgi:hypothetical protein